MYLTDVQNSSKYFLGHTGTIFLPQQQQLPIYESGEVLPSLPSSNPGYNPSNTAPVNKDELQSLSSAIKISLCQHDASALFYSFSLPSFSNPFKLFFFFFFSFQQFFHCFFTFVFLRRSDTDYHCLKKIWRQQTVFTLTDTKTDSK